MTKIIKVIFKKIKLIFATQLLINEGSFVTIKNMYEFLDMMVLKFAESYKIALSRTEPAFLMNKTI